MCGIAGFVNWNGEPASERLLKAMTDRLAHRGPDGEGQYVCGQVALGHRRLSIIDVDSGSQPMTNEDGSVWITFNGEIYNFKELRTLLEKQGHQFRTHSDTEVIVHGYEEWGAAVVERLRGMFAFAILDHRHRRLFLARDHFGIKPLMYYADQERFAFGSEAKAITAAPWVPREIDTEAVAEYFEYGYVPAPRSILKGVRKLMPGHVLSIDIDHPSAPEQQQYWALRYPDGPVTSEAESLEKLDHLLREAVRLQMVSDVPLGAMLSGGLDSSAIVSLMALSGSDQLKTFTIGFEEERFSEVAYARQVAEHVGTEHHEHTVRADVASLLPRLVYHFDEPFADASAVPTYYLCAMARKNVTVCLSGDGGDEMFAGYDRYQYCRDQGRLDAIPHGLRSALLGPLARVYPRSFPGAGAIGGATRTPEERFVQYMRGQYGNLDGSRLFSPGMQAFLPGNRRGFSYLTDAFDLTVTDPVHRFLDVDVRTYLPNDILTKVDVTSMMNSLEVRPPLLDHVLAEYVAGLPSSLKIHGHDSKYALKKVVGARLPSAVLTRRKMGFGVPMREWVATELRDFTRHYLLDSARSSGLLDTKVLRHMIEDNERHLYKSRTGGKLWWALFFEIWHQDVYGSPAVKL
jgi:asparagine synthase (glutamine-hydrolysing)